MAGSLIIRRARPVPLTADPVAQVVDVLIRNGRIAAVAESGTAAAGFEDTGVPEINADGRWLLPGLWDGHVHLLQWARLRSKLDLSAAESAADLCARLAVIAAADEGDQPLVGFGHRSAVWPDLPLVADLDAVTGDRPTALISGDSHQCWFNSAALRMLGLPPVSGALSEDDWFAIAPQVERLSARESEHDACARALQDAADRGVVGLVDFEFGDGWRRWPHRFAAGLDRLRIQVSCYADELPQVLAAGLQTGDPLDRSGRLTMGPFKIISDGSLNTRTAWCCQPYADHGDHPGGDHGQSNQTPEELLELLQRSRIGGLQVAVHAIGDRAVSAALSAIEASGARGSIEHAQLLQRSDLQRMARASVVASVQPAHLLDDRDVAEQVWPDRTDRCFMFASMLQAGVTLRLGSDAPVAPLDPWLAMAAAVHRSADDRPAWYADEALTAQQALAASTGGVAAVQAGGRGDLVLVDRDPLAGTGSADAARVLRQLSVGLTVVGGHLVGGPLSR
ncbi:amidohydrolase [Naumannella halotolerans]|uniref:Amidohydrolase 3 domain-containing protein n=1 Tax=Naumannella halotolerans TaxID=993414 RepID=A0A4R7JAT6_9ACTN|nr:amidohydrolase family protein [Naumannella halotolerans]TDT33683.1 hypothetical protein CLV29_1310 [Naumannella halotolerans]